jgi:hypothetical protein
MDDNGFGAEEEPEVQQREVEGNVVDVSKLPRVDLNQILRDYDPISVGTEPGREYVVVAPRSQIALPGEEWGHQLADPMLRHGIPKEKGKTRIGIGGQSGAIREHNTVDFAQGIGTGGDAGLTSELGTAVASPWTSWTRREYNSDLFGLKGLQVYDKMRKSDGTVRGTLRLAKTPVLAAQWGMKPASDNVRDVNIRDFVWANLQTWMSTSLPQFVTEALLMLDFGYYMFEKVFAHGEDVTADPKARGKIVWKKFAPRHPMDVKEWYFDLNGGPLSVDMWAPPVAIGDNSPGSLGTIPNNFEGGVVQAFQRWINIPIDKLAVFTFDKEAGNIEGISILRSAYKHWYYKDNLYKIDAIQKERHGIGVPVIQLPVGYSESDKLLADQLGRNLRTNERAHVVLPPAWILEFAELHGNPVDCLTSIKHHDNMIPQGILGQFMNTEKTDIEEQHTIFLKATRFTADIVLDVMNKYVIPQLVNLNWGRTVYPSLYAKRIGEQEDWRTQSFTLRNYVGAGIIVPDDPLEDQLRDEMGLPPREDASARLVRGTPQENEQKIQPNPTQEPGPGHKVIPNQMPGPGSTPGSQPTVPSAGLPRQKASPGTVAPSTGRGDGSGTSGRRGQ